MTPGAPPTRIDQLNASIRGIIVIAMTGAFIVGFLRGLVGAEAFLTIFGAVIAWWFRSRDEEKRVAASAAPPGGTPP